MIKWTLCVTVNGFVRHTSTLADILTGEVLAESYDAKLKVTEDNLTRMPQLDLRYENRSLANYESTFAGA